MDCTVKGALLKNYRDFTAGYVRAIKRIENGGAKMAQSDFSALRELAKDCEKKASAAKRQLQRHMSEHHC
jgi:hypothetical protein